MSLPRPLLRRLLWAVVIVGSAVSPRICEAVVLDPNAFPSLGTFTGGFVLDSGDGSTAPVIYSNGVVVATGVISNGVAVFDFDSFSGSGYAEGLLPIAVLSRGALTIGVMEANFIQPYIRYPGSGGDGGAAGGLGGPPGNPRDQPGTAGGGGAGAPLLGGGNAQLTVLTGPNSPYPGTGGSAFEFVALGTATIGDVIASGVIGAGAQGNFFGASGGGGGGSILVSGNAVAVTGTLNASGGTGGAGGQDGGPGGGGGGGLIDILYGPGGFTNNGTYLVAGGAAGAGTGAGPGANGSVTFQSVPEPSSVALLALGLAGLARAARRTRPARA